MSFYLSAVDDLLRHPGDGPSVGLILCKSRDRLVVEYALRDTSKPMGVSTYEVRAAATMPDHLKVNLPSPERLEEELTRRERHGE